MSVWAAQKHQAQTPRRSKSILSGQRLGTVPISETPRILGAGAVPPIPPAKAQGVPKHPTPKNQASEEVLLFCNLWLFSSLPALFPLKSQGREERDARAGAMAMAASIKPRGHFAKGDAKQPGKHARGHLKGTRHKKRKQEESVEQ